MLRAVQQGDDSGREVYADWLEANSRDREAGYVRAELKLQRTPDRETGGAPRGRSTSCANAGRYVSSEFRAWVSRPAIESCNLRFELQCPLKWESLAPTDDAMVRDCSICKQSVRFCSTVEEAAGIAQRGGCVAVDLGPARHPDDLRPVRAMMGRIARRR